MTINYAKAKKQAIETEASCLPTSHHANTKCYDVCQRILIMCVGAKPSMMPKKLLEKLLNKMHFLLRVIHITMFDYKHYKCCQ